MSLWCPFLLIICMIPLSIQFGVFLSLYLDVKIRLFCPGHYTLILHFKGEAVFSKLWTLNPIKDFAPWCCKTGSVSLATCIAGRYSVPVLCGIVLSI